MSYFGTGRLSTVQSVAYTGTAGTIASGVGTQIPYQHQREQSMNKFSRWQGLPQSSSFQALPPTPEEEANMQADALGGGEMGNFEANQRLAAAPRGNPASDSPYLTGMLGNVKYPEPPGMQGSLASGAGSMGMGNKRPTPAPPYYVAKPGAQTPSNSGMMG